MPSSDDFDLVEEEEEEEQPRMVPGSRVLDAHGRSWCRVAGPAGVYWWMIGTSTAQYTPSPSRMGSPPGQGGIQILASVVAPLGNVPVTLKRQLQQLFEFFVPQVPQLPLGRAMLCRQWIHILR